MTLSTPPTRSGYDLPWEPVAQGLVHKTAAAEVLVTGLAPVAPQLVAVAARWPAPHRLYDRRAGTVGHLLLVVETIRQAGLCLAHRHVGVPLGEQFIFHRIATRLAAPVEDLEVVTPASTVTLVRPTVRLRAARPAGARLAIEMWHGTTLWATADADFSWAPRPVYERLRAAARDRARAEVARLVPTPRVAGPAERGGDGAERSRVVVDLGDPTYFDHAVDHLPGMLLVDAAVRAAAARAGAPGATARPTGVELTFDRFAELDRPTWARTEPGAGGVEPSVAVTLGQGDAVVARGRVVCAG